MGNLGVDGLDKAREEDCVGGDHRGQRVVRWFQQLRVEEGGGEDGRAPEARS